MFEKVPAQEGFYGTEGVPSSEINRLQRQAEFANEVSKELLESEELAGKTLLDAGAGSSSAGFAQFVEDRGGQYIPLDLRAEMLHALKEKRGETDRGEEEGFGAGVQGSIMELPFADESINLAHERFVLMHLSPDERKKAVSELMRVSKEKIFLVEFNWDSLASSSNDPRLLDFKKYSAELQKLSGIEPNMGDRLPELIEAAAPGKAYHLTRFDRDEGNYTDDFVGLAQISSDMALRQMPPEDAHSPEDQEKRERLRKLAEEFLRLKKEMEESPFVCVPHQIVGAEIEK